MPVSCSVWKHEPRPEFLPISTGMSETTGMLEGVEWGRQSPDELLPLVYHELRRLAAARMAREQAGHTLQPTALVHEAWLRLTRNGTQLWQNRSHFFAAAAEAMRRILIESARRRARLKHGGARTQPDVADLELVAVSPDEKVLLINEALKQLELEDPERAEVVKLKFFGGLTNRQAAETLGLSERSVNRQWTYAKAWLFRHIRGQV